MAVAVWSSCFVNGSAGYANGIILFCNGFPRFSFGLLVTLSVNFLCKIPLFAPTFSVIIVELSGSKIWFPRPFFCTVSGMLFRVHVYTDTEKFTPSLPS